MRAAVLQAHGTIPVIHDRPDPVPDDRHALLAVRAAPIAQLDLLCASGTSYFGRQPTPYVPGVQGVGEVLSADLLPAGSRVWFATRAGMAPGDGSLAERCVVATDDLVLLPPGVPDAVTAAIGTSGIAAWLCLTWRGRLRPGETVVVLGAGGVVGQVALAAARSLGAGRVVAVCRASSRQRADRAGADAVVGIDGTEDQAALAHRIAAASGGGVDLIIDPVFGKIAAAAALTLRAGGRLVNLGGSAGDAAEFSSAVLRSRSIDILGYTNNAITPQQRAAALTSALALAEQGLVQIEPVVRRLADCAQAWAEAMAGARVVLEISPDR